MRPVSDSRFAALKIESSREWEAHANDLAGAISEIPKTDAALRRSFTLLWERAMKKAMHYRQLEQALEG